VRTADKHVFYYYGLLLTLFSLSRMAGDTGKGKGKGFPSRFGIGRSSSRSQSSSSGGQAGPSRVVRSQETDASDYFKAMAMRAGRSPTTGTGPSEAAPRRSTTTRMSIRMPKEDRFRIPYHLLDMVRIPGYVELSVDTTRSGGAAVIAAVETVEPVDGHPVDPWVSD
jgi:hypothetical protein